MISHAIAARFEECHFQTADSVLHETAFSGDAPTLRKLVIQRDLRGQLDKRNHLGCTPLRLAATGGHVKAVEVLLEAGASVDIADVKAQTPLFVAVKNNYYDCAKLLLQHGATTEGSDDNLATPLYTAAMAGQANMIQLLIDHGSDVNCETNRVYRTFQMDPLQIAVAYHRYTCIKLLLRAGARQTTPLFHVAVKQKCGVAIMRLLYEMGVDLYRKDNTGKFPWQHNLSSYPEDDGVDVLKYLDHIRENPRSLKSNCRLCILQNLRPEYKLKKQVTLCLPATLVDYLMCGDLTV